MYQKKSSKQASWKGRKRAILLILLFLVCWWTLHWHYLKAIDFWAWETISIQKGDTVAKFYRHIGNFDKMMMKLWLRNNSELIPTLQEGNYTLSGEYTKSQLMEIIAKGPEQQYERITLLEGRSLYDIDAYLTEKDLLGAGKFIEKAQDQAFIQRLKSDFSFLSHLPAGQSLEGFLYPDTYFITTDAGIAEQLIRAQLKNFAQKIWKPYQAQLASFKPYAVDLSTYKALTLASVIENEEKTASNKPIIAGIFINRLAQGMRLDADVSLCYGLKLTYTSCRPAIVPNLSDKSNPYNTRQNPGLPPSPISSPSSATLWALLNYQKTSALYYLHDKNGGIHYGSTLQEHNENKQRYLGN